MRDYTGKLAILNHLPLALTVVFVAAVIQGMAGFAFGILSMAFLTILWEPQTANVVVTLLAMYSITHGLWSIRRAIVWHHINDLTLGFVVGIPLGTALLVLPNTTHLIRALVAVACLLVAAQNWFGAEPVPGGPRPSRAFTLGSGTFAGILSGSVSSGGPPILWYVYRQPWTRDELKATSLAMFLVGGVIKLLTWAGHDLTSAGPALFTRERLLIAAIFLPITVLGTSLGVKLFNRVDRTQLRHLVCFLLAIMAVLVLLSL